MTEHYRAHFSNALPRPREPPIPSFPPSEWGEGASDSPSVGQIGGREDGHGATCFARPVPALDREIEPVFEALVLSRTARRVTMDRLRSACRRLRGDTRRPARVATSLRVVARRLRCVSRHPRGPRLGLDPLSLEPAGETRGLRRDRRRLREGARRLRRISRQPRGDPGGRRRTCRGHRADTIELRGELRSRRGNPRQLRGVPRRLRELPGPLAGSSRPPPTSSRWRRCMSRELA
jgi:hypothetical protein